MATKARVLAVALAALLHVYHNEAAASYADSSVVASADTSADTRADARAVLRVRSLVVADSTASDGAVAVADSLAAKSAAVAVADMSAVAGAVAQTGFAVDFSAVAESKMAVFQRESLRHNAAIANISRSMTVDHALKLLKDHNQAPASLFAFVQKALGRDTDAGRSSLRSGRKALAAHAASQPQGSTIEGTSIQSAGAAYGSELRQAKEMLNELIFQVQMQYEVEHKKCCDYESTKRNLIEEAAQDIALFNAEAAEARSRMLRAQSQIGIAEGRVPKLRESLAEHDKKCTSSLAAMTRELEITANDKAVMTGLSNLTDCGKQQQVDLLQCTHPCGEEPHMLFGSATFRDVVRKLKSNTVRKILQHNLLSQAHKSKSAHRSVGALLQQELDRDLELDLASESNVTERFIKPNGPCEKPIPTDKRSSKCAVTGASCEMLQERLLVVQMAIIDKQTELKQEIAKLTKSCGEVKKSLENQISDFATQLVAEQGKLASATKTQNTADEQNRLKTVEKSSMETEFATMTGTCHRNYQSYEEQECGLKKIRGELFKMKAPDAKAAFEDCQLSQWTAGACSASCNGGVQVLKRTIVAQPNGGVRCLPLEQRQSCNEHKCPVDCKLDDWQSWSGCTAECGGGVMQRARQVEVKPRGGGKPCGETSEVSGCNLGSCNQNCALAAWTPWSQCSKGCGSGRQRRLKFIETKAKGTGTCPHEKDESRLEFKSCNTRACPTNLDCQTALDVVVMLDSSSGVGMEGWESIKKAGEGLVKALGASGRVKVGVVLFSGPNTLQGLSLCTNDDPNARPPDLAQDCNIHVVSRLTSDAATVVSKIKNLKWLQGSALTSVALGAAEGELSLGRKDAASVVIVLTLGRPLSVDQTTLMARRLRQTARVMWVPVAGLSSLDNFRKWSSDPDDENIIPVHSFNQLRTQSTIDHIVSMMCPQVSIKEAVTCDTIRLNVPEDWRTYSSVWAQDAGHRRSTLDSPQAWSAGVQEKGQWMQIDLKSVRTVRGLVTQGRANSEQYVTKYSVKYSEDGKEWESIPGRFDANRDRSTRVQNLFQEAIAARYIRITVEDFTGFPSMRAAVLVCGHVPNTCTSDVANFGEDVRRYSSVWANDKGHQRSTLDSPQAWSAAKVTPGEWVQIDLGKPWSVRGIVTQGRANFDQWVTRYSVDYSLNGETWFEVPAVFEGNTDRNTKVTGLFPEEVTARYIRVVVEEFSGHPSMRVGVLFCSKPPRVTCHFTVDNNVESVFYNGKSILDSVMSSPTNRLDDWTVPKQVTFSLVPGAYFTVTGAEADPNGSCALSGFAIKCDDSRANNPKNWEAYGSNKALDEADEHRSGAGGGWEATCQSTSDFTLAKQPTYLKLWGGNNKFVSFRWRT